MDTERFEMRVPGDLLERLDAMRGYESRASFIRRALESALRVPPLEGLGPNPSPAVVRAAAASAGSSVGAFGRARDFELSGGGCPECGGQWTRRPGESGRFCVDCGGREAS